MAASLELGRDRAAASYDDTMGFNPFRKQRKNALDITLVVVFVAITLVFVAWGFWGS